MLGAQTYLQIFCPSPLLILLPLVLLLLLLLISEPSHPHRNQGEFTTMYAPTRFAVKHPFIEETPTDNDNKPCFSPSCPPSNATKVHPNPLGSIICVHSIKSTNFVQNHSSTSSPTPTNNQLIFGDCCCGLSYSFKRTRSTTPGNNLRLYIISSTRHF